MRKKPISFRPTPKAEEIINAEMLKHPDKDKTQVINDCIEQTRSEQNGDGEKIVLWSYRYLPRPETPPFLQKELERFLRGEDSEVIKGIFALR